MAVKASGRFVPPSAFAAGTGKAFTGAYAWNAPREAVGRERPLTRDEMRQVQGVLSTINRLPYFLRSLFTSRYDYIRRNKSPVINTHQNIAAFLDMLAVSEGTANHPLTKNRGYDVIVTGLDGKPEIFTDYSDHPFAHGRPAKVFNRRGEKSTASGRYQQLYLFWPHYRKQLALPDFSPLSQDRLAIQLIRERGALDDIRAGRIERAISRCRNIWASLPGAGYGQREHSLEKLVTVWRTAGGVPA